MLKSKSASALDTLRTMSDADRGDLKGTIRLGVCAMNKKAQSRPMQEILGRLCKLQSSGVEDGPVFEVQALLGGGGGAGVTAARAGGATTRLTVLTPRMLQRGRSSILATRSSSRRKSKTGPWSTVRVPCP